MTASGPASRVALVTGAARGIGAAIVRRLLADGVCVVALDRPGAERPPGQPDTGRIVLLDFGAMRAFAPDLAEKFRRLAQAGMAGDRAAARQAMLEIGFFDEGSPRIFQAAVLVMFDTAFRPTREQPAFDFADPSLVGALREQATALAEKQDALRAPPVDALFLQRKAGGLFLLASRLKARVKVGALLAGHLAGDRAEADPASDPPPGNRSSF